MQFTAMALSHLRAPFVSKQPTAPANSFTGVLLATENN